MSVSNRVIRQNGFSLLEVLIALFILAVGVLGALLMQTNALRFSASAADRTQASFIAYDLLDRLRANSAELELYAVSVAPGCHVAAPPSGTTIRSTDLADFTHAVSCLLPAGQGQVSIDGQRATVTLSWSEERILAGAGDAMLTVSALIRGQP